MFPEATNALRKAIVCNNAEIGEETGDNLTIRVRHVKLLFQLANTYGESQHQTDAIRTMETCLEALDILRNRGDLKMDEEDMSTFSSILRDGQQLVAEWIADEATRQKRQTTQPRIN